MLTLAIVTVTLIAIYFYNIRNFDYWKIRGVNCEKPVIFLGTVKEVYLHKKSCTQYLTNLYFKNPNEKVVGFFRSMRPGLVIRDPEIIKRILITDFNNFHNRGIFPSNALEPLLRNPLLVDGDLWHLLRQRMTPAFTGGKLKAMFPLITERAEQLQARTLKAVQKGSFIDARDLMARYTIDFIGVIAFGIDADSLNNDNSPFRKLGVNIFHIGLREFIILLLKDIFPSIFKSLKFFPTLENQIVDLVSYIQKQRNYQPSNRNDFIDLLLECKKKGIMKGESIEQFNKNGTPKEVKIELDDLLMAAQIFAFFAAGFETSSSATSMTLHQLAYHPEIQEKVQKEIDTVLAKHDGKLSYDAIKEMAYLELAFKESLRIFSSPGYIIRTCVKRYTFPELNVTIDKDVMVLIPIQALHCDPKYWDKPNDFRPERFHPDELKNIPKAVYLPFGDGPRTCIGERLALMQSLGGLAAILSRFTIEPAPHTKRHPSVQTKPDIVQVIDGGLPLIFRERKKR